MQKSKKTSKVTKSAHSSAPLRPLGDRVVIKPLTPEEMGTKTASGIIIPDTAKEKPEQGKVVAVGPGKFDECGEHRIPISVKVGDRVMFSKYGYDEIKINGIEYYVVSENNILAILD